jgi:uncharacterized protein
VRAVVDTNVLVSGLLWRGAPHLVLQQLRGGTVARVSSPALLEEFAAVIGRAKFDAIVTRSSISRDKAVAEIRQLAEVVDPPPLMQPVCRDPDDDALLALAVAAGTDLIVTGDADLLALASFAGIPIVDSARALGMLV